jgi:hypothetical protein
MLTQVSDNVYRIDNARINNELNYHQAASPRTYKELYTKLGLSLDESLNTDLDFRKGRTSNHWYIQTQPFAATA